MKRMSLARFRVDPERVRVGIRQSGRTYIVTVESRIHSGVYVTSRSLDPRRAVRNALAKAEACIPGIDIGMQWVYDHPYGLDA